MIHCHVHTCYSLLDGLILPKELMRKCAAGGDGAVACTDHGSVAGLVEFHTEANKAGVKPILGYEAYHDRGDDKNYHLTLLARNRTGYNNLIKLNNLAHDNFYKKPRITDEMLRTYGSGLIALTGCMQGYFPQTIVRGRPDTQWLIALQGWVDLAFLEVQNHGIPEEAAILDWAMRHMPEKAVATADLHYLEEREANAHSIGLAISFNKKWGPSIGFVGKGYHYHTPDLPNEAVDRTLHVASLVESYDIGYDSWQMPTEDIDTEQEFAELNFRLDDYVEFELHGDENLLKTYRDRLKMEWGVLYSNNFIPYIRMVAKICEYVDHELRSVRGWGRGSAGGSLVVMLYGITRIDPIKWGLHFERFVNPDRIVPPDIDLDFKPSDRIQVMEFMRRTYGRIYQIGTYTTLGSKEVVRSVERALDLHTGLQEYVPVEAPVPTIHELMDRGDAFAQYVREHHLEDFVDICMSLEGRPRNSSAHASGVVIDLHGDIPVMVKQSGVNKGVPVTAYDMYSLERQGFVKIDILGVNMLSILDDAIRSINKEDPAKHLSLEKIPLDDAKTFELFNSGHTLGVFQAEAHSFTSIAEKVKPVTFDELVDLQTLTRPGCIESGMTDLYIKRKFGDEMRGLSICGGKYVI